MILLEINKSRYRQHLNRVIFACIASLTIGSLAIAQGLIFLFPSEQGSHFHWNLSGVIISCFIIATVLIKNKSHEYMTEVVYVWDLKQALNQITRKLRQVNLAVEQNDVTAMQILHFYYMGSKQLYLLDDNTIMIDELNMGHDKLTAIAKNHHVTLDEQTYHKDMLKTL